MTYRRIAAAFAASTVLVITGLLGAPAARADSGVWGPTEIPYSNGIVCQVGNSATALVSWPNSATSGPAFATAPVTGPVDGASGVYSTPATAPATTAPPANLSAQQQASLAVLIGFFGTSGDPATVANVAALTATDGACYSAGIPGVDVATAQSLSQRATSFSGPYSVSIGSSAKLIPNTSGTVYADVRSAAGVALSGVPVSFTADGTSLTASGTTDDSGRAQVAVQLPGDWSSDQLVVHARIALPVTVVELSAPGAVPLLAAGPPQDFEGQAPVPVDTTADPVVQVKADPALVLTGMAANAQVGITGMRGHAGKATITAIGPLTFRPDTGCASYQRADWEAGTTVQVADGAPFTGDTTLPVSLAKLVDTKGCYLLQARVDTTDATPQATANSDPADAGSVLGVAPVKVGVEAADHGLALVGPLAATLTVDGSVPAKLTGTSGSVLGPRLADRGVCPADGWNGAASAGNLTATADGDAANDVQVTSGDVSADGCYLLRMNTTVELPGIGSVPIQDAEARSLVLAPRLTVTALSTHGVLVGGQVRATVDVAGTLQHRGSLTLRLARLADGAGGCFGRDYRGATPTSSTSAPATATTGDGSFVVTTPEVPSTGCWTVLPTLTFAADTTLRVDAPAPEQSMVAFTATQPQHAEDLGGATQDVDRTTRYVIAAVVAAVLVIGALVVTVRVAFATSEDDTD